MHEHGRQHSPRRGKLLKGGIFKRFQSESCTRLARLCNRGLHRQLGKRITRALLTGALCLRLARATWRKAMKKKNE